MNSTKNALISDTVSLLKKKIKTHLKYVMPIFANGGGPCKYNKSFDLAKQPSTICKQNTQFFTS